MDSVFFCSLISPRFWAGGMACPPWIDRSADVRWRGPHYCFGCQSAQDSVWHYAHCPVVANLARTRLHMTLAPYGDRLGDFLLLHPCPDPSAQALRALCLYATFLATNAVRNGRATLASEVWIQAITDVAGREYPLKRIMYKLWCPPSSSTDHA